MHLRALGFMLLIALSDEAQASEILIGSAGMELQGGLLGLQGGVESYGEWLNYKTEHTSIRSGRLFYDYSIAYLTPTRSFNESISVKNLQGGEMNIIGAEFEWSGIDAQATLGYDLFRWGERDYIGLGLSLGIAAPVIKNAGIDVPSADWMPNQGAPVYVEEGDSEEVSLVASTTEFLGYKLGPKLLLSKALGDRAAVYGEISYAPQQLSIRNKNLDYRIDIDGDYFHYALGIRYELMKSSHSLGLLNIEPRLGLDFGVQYSRLHLQKFNLDLSGMNYAIPKTELSLESHSLYLGVSYAL
ncbi:hypothetical protein [Thiomicrorhabdus sp.]|uniref:hypothetical protein n=1 Tax=Thiomicrorhabdus sp. TaxID=2039724 RepID=UPI0029C64679|nr:hypothetical protein [Thiomicrorhabdus sp.]